MSNIPPLDVETYQALYRSIEKWGVLVPVIRNKATDALIDGRNRTQIANTLGIYCPVEFVNVPEDATEEQIAVEVNLVRRHLTIEQRRLISADLYQAGTTMKEIGRVTGVSESQVQRDLSPEHPRGSSGDRRVKVTPELRAEVTERLLADEESATQLSQEYGIAESTLKDWRRKATTPPAPRRKFVKPSKAFPEMAHMLDGLVSALAYVDTEAVDLDSVRSWIESMNQSIHKLTRFLREISNGRTDTPDGATKKDSEEGPSAMGAHSSDAPEPGGSERLP
jgi:transposase-like protein